MEQRFEVGFARTDITPRCGSVPLGGYGATEYRLSSCVGAPIYAHLTAMRQGDETCLYIATDLIGIGEKTLNLYREAISEETGLRKDRIFLCGTHTHSAPDLKSDLPNLVKYRDEELRDDLVAAAKRALADFKPAKISYGTVDVGRDGLRLNFDRHYYCVPIEKKDNWTEADLLDGVGEVRNGYLKGEGYAAVKHKEEGDHRMHLIRFARENADDVVLVNYTGHPCYCGGSKWPEINPDYPGAFVKRMEYLFPETKFAFLQGCAGNMVTSTEIAEEGVWGVTYPPRNPKALTKSRLKLRSWAAYADALAGYAYKGLTENMTDSATETLAVNQRIMKGVYDHTKDHLVETAKEALKPYLEQGHSPETHAHCAKYGLGSVYSCMAILRRAKLPESGEIELNAIRIGDCAIATIPFEPFSSLGEYIKEQSPFAMTAVNGYSCGYQGYLPNKDSTANNYESSTTPYMPDTGEKLKLELVDMLKEL